MSETLVNLLIQGSKEGIDQHGMDHEIIFSRSQDVRTPNARLIYKVVGLTYDIIHFAKTVEPRLAEYLIPDAKNYKYMIASFGSINGSTLTRVGTTTSRQEHVISQQSIQNRSKFESIFKGKPKDQGDQQLPR